MIIKSRIMEFLDKEHDMVGANYHSVCNEWKFCITIILELFEHLIIAMTRRELLDIIDLNIQKPSDSLFEAGPVPEESCTARYYGCYRKPKHRPTCKDCTNSQNTASYHKQVFHYELWLLCGAAKWHYSKCNFCNCNQGTKNSCISAFNTLQEWNMTHKALTTYRTSLNIPRSLTNVPRKASTCVCNSSGGVGLHFFFFFWVKYFRRLQLILSQ